MKLWDKGYSVDERIDKFTVGHDRDLDVALARFDILGTMAHITMLESVGLLSDGDLKLLLKELKKLYDRAAAGDLVIEDDIEDIHSQIELELTRALGDVGKKVHTGRSRNDQVLVDLKLYARSRIEKTVELVKDLFEALQESSEKYSDILLPGYTHLQIAMPSSFGLWFGAYAESLTADLSVMASAWDVVNSNPLGSAAGYGSSAPLNRKMTTALLGFADMDWNVVYAQMSRGKTERTVASAYASLAETIGRLATDCCMYTSQNFGFIHLPDTLTTGSSIMPHKKNPDVFELIRAHCNRISSIQNTIRMITSPLPSGYFRDMQLLKEVWMPMFDEMDDCLSIVTYAIRNITVENNILDNPNYHLVFTVEEVNDLVNKGVPFRDAYRKVGREVLENRFSYNGQLHHTHEGSIGNLCNDKIREKLQRQLTKFTFEKVKETLNKLLLC